MKKSLIALAVLAASGASFAQSTVNVYGIADIWLGNLKASKVSDKADSTTVMESGGVSGSRWGLKGAEDLGGGLKAVFTLEQGIALDTGAGTAGQAFSRLSYVGLAGGFGEVTFGKMWTATDDVMGVSNSGFDSGLSATNGVWVANSVYSSNPGNSIKYASPSFGGVTFAVSYGLDETPNITKDMVDFNVAYAGGPIAVNFAYQVQNDSSADDLKITTLNGSYDFGVAKLLASYAQTKSGDFDVKDYQIGVDVPVSSAITVSGGFARSSRNDVAAASIAADNLLVKPAMGLYNGTTNTGFGVAVAYSMSKRTTLYGGVSSAKGETGGADVSKRQLYAVGVKHTF